MKLYMRLFGIVMVLLLLLTALAACAVIDKETPASSQHIEQSADLTRIKNQWQHYVIDRTEQVSQVQITLGLADSHMGLVTAEENINAALDICKTLDISKLRLLSEEEFPEISIYGDLNVIISGDDSKSGISLRLTKDGKVYISGLMNSDLCYAYAESWPVYDSFYKLKYSKYFE